MSYGMEGTDRKDSLSLQLASVHRRKIGKESKQMLEFFNSVHEDAIFQVFRIIYQLVRYVRASGKI